MLGGLVLWLLYRNTKLDDVARLLSSSVDYTILALSLVFGLLANILRGFRWHLLVRPVVTHGSEPRIITAVCTVLGSYAVNMGIPRSGELWRCAEYKRYESLPFSTLLGTLINDRLMDVLCLGMILMAVVLGYYQDFVSFINQHTSLSLKLEGLASSPWLYLALTLLCLVSLGLFYYVRLHPESKVSKLIRMTMQGILSIRAMQQRGRFLAYSISIWALYFLFFYTTFFAFPFTQSLPIEAGLIAFAMSSLSVIAPVQNGMGPWHFMVITTLVGYGVSREDAGAFALIVHTLQTLWIALIGLVAILALPLLSRGYRRATDTQD